MREAGEDDSRGDGQAQILRCDDQRISVLTGLGGGWIGVEGTRGEEGDVDLELVPSIQRIQRRSPNSPV